MPLPKLWQRVNYSGDQPYNYTNSFNDNAYITKQSFFITLVLQQLKILKVHLRNWKVQASRHNVGIQMQRKVEQLDQSTSTFASYSKLFKMSQADEKTLRQYF